MDGKDHTGTRIDFWTSAALCVAGACIMAMGWGVRGSYGHGAAAAMAGALVAMAVALNACRPDWWRRAAIFGALGAVGWYFGGQSSYGRLTGYVSADNFADTLYGYAALFTVGGLWGGIGLCFVGIAATKSRAFLRQCVGPFTAVYVAWFLIDKTGVADRLGAWKDLYDTDWPRTAFAVLVAGLYWLAVPRQRAGAGFVLMLATGWWAGLLVLTMLLGLRMTPPRSDSWAAVMGVFVTLLIYFATTRNRVSLALSGYGFLGSGFGFATAVFLHMLYSLGWGPFGLSPLLKQPDNWTFAEQTFGFIMGLTVAVGIVRVINGRLTPPEEDGPRDWLDEYAAFLLLVPLMWINYKKNVSRWIEAKDFPSDYLGLSLYTWTTLLALTLVGLIVFALYRYHKGQLPLAPGTALGKGQLLFLISAWFVVLGYFVQAENGNRSSSINVTTFWIGTFIASLMVLRLSAKHAAPPSATVPPNDKSWRPGWRYWGLWLLLPIYLVLITWATLAVFPGPRDGHAHRFGPHAYQKDHKD